MEKGYRLTCARRATIANVVCSMRRTGCERGNKKSSIKQGGSSNLKALGLQLGRLQRRRRILLPWLLLEERIHQVNTVGETFLGRSRGLLGRRCVVQKGSVGEGIGLNLTKRITVLLSRADGSLKLLSPVSTQVETWLARGAKWL